MRTVTGNLLDMFDNGDFDIIVHGCNCHNNMGGGIAAQIAKRYPKVQNADLDTVCGDESKLGTVVPVWMSNRWLRWIKKPRIVVNAYTQFHPGADARIEAVRAAFIDLADWARRENLEHLSFGIPAIGCGIGGLTWEEVEMEIIYSCNHLDITLVEFG